MEEVRNIGPKGCTRRIRIGSAALLFSAVYLAVLIITRPNAFFWLPVLISTFIGLVSLLQAIEKTCISLAAQGFQMIDDSTRAKITDEAVAKKLRHKSTRLLIKAVVLTSLLIIFYFLVPKS